MKPQRSISLALVAPAALFVTLVAPLILHAADGTWTSTTSGNWTDTAMWSGGTIADGSGSAADFSTLDISTDITVTLGADRTIGNLTFGDADVATAGGWTITGNALTLAGGTPTIEVHTLGAGKIATIQSTLTGSSGLVKTGAGQLTVSNGGNGSLTGTILVNQGLLVFNTTTSYNDAFGKSAPVHVSGGAELRLTGGVNSYIRTATDGGMLLDGGIFDYQASSHGHMGNITLQNGGVWKATSGGGYNGENMQLNGTVTVSGSSASTIGPFSSGLGLNGIRTFNVADVTGDAGVDLTVSAELENNDSGAGDGIIKTGNGLMNITTGASYSGSTTINGGTLRLSNTLRSTSSVTVNNGATLETSATNIFVDGHNAIIDASRVITLNGSTWIMTASHDARVGNVVLNDGSTWTSDRELSGWDALLGNVSSGAATVSVTGVGASSMVGSSTKGIHLQGIQNFDVADVTGNADNDLNVSMVLAGPGNAGGDAGGIHKLGAGTMSLTRTNTYGGGTTVTAGILSLDGGGGSAGTIRGTATVNAGAVLRLATNDATGYGGGSDALTTINLNGGTLHVTTTGGPGQNQTFGKVTLNMTGASVTGVSGSSVDLFGDGAKVVTAASPTTSSIGVTVLNLRQDDTQFDVADGAAAQDLLISSNIGNGDRGNHNMIKQGAGKMVLTGANSYTGTTQISAGTMIVDGTHTGGGLISVGANATLGGSGSVGDVNVSDNGMLSPGDDGVGHFDVEDLTLALDSALAFELGAPALTPDPGTDFVNIRNTLTLGGKLHLSAVSGFGTPVAGDRWLIMSFAGGIDDTTPMTISSAPALSPGLSYGLDYSDWANLYVTVVPEAGSGMLAALGLFLILRRRLCA